MAGPLGVKETEVQGSCGQVGEPSKTEDSQAVPEGSCAIEDDEVPRACSRSRKPRKCAQSITTINSDGDDEKASSQPRPNVRDMQTPDAGYEWVDDKDRCIKCIQ